MASPTEVSAVAPRDGVKVQKDSTEGVDWTIAALAGRQHGVVARGQLLRLGLTRKVIERRIAAGSLIPIHRGVYMVGHRAAPPLAPEMGAVLAHRGRAAASHLSAGAVLELTSRPTVVHVTVPHGARSRRGIVVHCSPLDPTEVRRHQRIPVTSPARTLLDLAAILEPDDFERAAAEAWSRRIVRRQELEDQLTRSPHRRGAPALRALLALDRDPARTRSRAERLLLRLIRDARLPEPETNQYVGPHEVDCLWRAQRLVVEFDSWSFHSSRRAFERDRRKDAALLALGYRVLRLTWRRLTGEPQAVVALLNRALRAATQ